MAVLMAERVDRSLTLFGFAPEQRDVPAARGSLGGGLTLDDAIVGAWEGLAAQAVVACPLCGGALRPAAQRAGAGGSRAGDPVVGGRCGDCGTTLG